MSACAVKGTPMLEVIAYDESGIILEPGTVVLENIYSGCAVRGGHHCRGRAVRRLVGSPVGGRADQKGKSGPPGKAGGLR